MDAVQTQQLELDFHINFKSLPIRIVEQAITLMDATTGYTVKH